MSGSALRERLHLLDELRQIVGAMKNLAYAELQRCNRVLPAQAEAEAVLLGALARLKPLVDDAPTGGARVLLAIGSERGFCGGFNDHLAEALRPEAARPDTRILVAGERLRQRLESILPEAEWLPGCASSDEAAEVVERWQDALAAPMTARVPDVRVLHQSEAGPIWRQVLPWPELPPPASGEPPYRYLPIPSLLAGLRASWLRIALLGALHHSLHQENHWRLNQMQRAEEHLDESNQALARRYFRQRQTEITSELETLMSSLEINRPLGAGRD